LPITAAALVANLISLRDTTVAVAKTIKKSLSRQPARFVEPMQCLAVAKLPEGPDWEYEIKFDGYQHTIGGLLGNDDGRLDPEEMIAAMVRIVPADMGKFRNVVPQAVEDFPKVHQQKAWENQI
jgi:hypothetical protein